MKKWITALLSLVFLGLFAGCDMADVQVTAKDGVAYFSATQVEPTMMLLGEEEKEIEDEAFLWLLGDAIDFQPISAEPNCGCDALYTVAIQEYRFGIHSHGIEIKAYIKDWRKHMNYIGMVECDPETMEPILTFLENME